MHLTIGNRTYLLPLALALVALGLYLSTLAPGLTWGDSGEFIAVANILGIGHPYGHPLYWLAGRASIILAPGDPAWAMNLLSAISGAATCFFVALLAQLWTKALPRRLSNWATALTTAIFMTGTVFWSQSLFTEVYAFQALFIAASLYTFDLFLRNNSGNRFLYCSAYVFGLSLTLGIYAAIILVVPFVDLVSNQEKRSKILPALPLAFLWFILGLTPWIYLYARNLPDFPFTVRSLNSFSSYIDYLSRKAYDDTFVAGFGALGVSIRQLGDILIRSYHVIGLLSLSLIALVTFRNDRDRLVSTRFLAALLSTLLFALMVPLTLSFRQMIDMDVYFIPAIIAFVPVLSIGVAQLLKTFDRAWFRLIVVIVFVIPIILKYDSVSMSHSHLAPLFKTYLNDNLPHGSKVWPVADEVAQVLIYDINCNGNPDSVTLQLPITNSLQDPLGGLGAASLSDFLDIDDKFIDKPTIFDNCAIAGPFMSTRGATNEARQMEEEFVRFFSPNKAEIDRLHHYDRIFLAQTWGRRGFFWLRKSSLPKTTPEYSAQCVDNSIVCYRQALVLDDYTYEGASHAGNLAIALALKGDLTEADSLIRHALKINPRVESPWRAKLTTSLKQQRYNDALDALIHLVNYSRYPAEIWIDMATLYLRHLNQPEKAVTAYKTGVALGGGRRGSLERSLYPASSK